MLPPAVGGTTVLCDAQRLDALDIGPDSLGCIPEVHCMLRVEPELGRVAEQTRKPKRHFRTHRPTLAEQFVDRLTRDAQRISKTGGCQPVIGQIILPKHLAGMDRPDLPVPSVWNAHVTPPLSDNL